MQFELKQLSPEGVPAAIQKAERYRFLNQPWAAESICRDVLAVEPENQRAIVVLILALTDQFAEGGAERVGEARELLARLRDPYQRAYYAGIVCERRAKAQLGRGAPGAGFIAYEGLREAMQWYEQAETVRPPGNEDAILRWNTCARMIMRDRHLVARGEEEYAPSLED
jgi:hypothetical protein